MLILLVVINYLRGTGKVPSIVGVTKCSPLDNALFAILVVSGFLVTGVSGLIVKRENTQKLKVNYPFVTGDFQFTLKNAIKLPAIALVGAFFAGSLGIGAGLIFNPIII